jgi:hypothetical protein
LLPYVPTRGSVASGDFFQNLQHSLKIVYLNINVLVLNKTVLFHQIKPFFNRCDRTPKLEFNFIQDLKSYCTTLKIKIMLKTIVYGNITSSSACLLMSKKGGAL